MKIILQDDSTFAVPHKEVLEIEQVFLVQVYLYRIVRNTFAVGKKIVIHSPSDKVDLIRNRGCYPEIYCLLIEGLGRVRRTPVWGLWRIFFFLEVLAINRAFRIEEQEVILVGFQVSRFALGLMKTLFFPRRFCLY